MVVHSALCCGLLRVVSGLRQLSDRLRLRFGLTSLYGDQAAENCVFQQQVKVDDVLGVVGLLYFNVFGCIIVEEQKHTGAIMTADIIRVMLVDDHPFIRMGYRTILEQDGHFDVCAEAEKGSQAYFYYQKYQPEVVLMDISLPDVSGIEITRKIVNKDPDARVLMASMHRETTFVERAMEVGALGYITKITAADLLPEALKQVATGKLYLDAELAQALAEAKIMGNDDPFGSLSPREFEVLRMVLGGHNTQSIAGALKVSAKTVSNLCTTVRHKLNVSSNVELFQLAMRHGLIEC